MKSSFLLTAVIALTAFSAYGQTKKINPLQQTPVPTTTTVTQPAEPETKSSFDRFYDRLKISYYGAFTSPSMDDMGHGRFKNALTSTAFGGSDKEPNGPKKNQDTWPTNLWNQIGFRYNFGAKMDFVFNPRFMIPLASSTNMKKPEDRSFIELEDFLVGFQGVPYTSADKKFNLWIRPGVRLPVSRASRDASNGGFGQTTYQLELAYNPTYDFNPTWQVGIFGQFRDWIFENRYQYERFRFYTAPYVQYTINDTTRLQMYYQNIIENNKRRESVNGKKPVFKDYYQDIMLGVNKDLTKKFNVFPYFGFLIDDPVFSMRSIYIGAWISYQIK